MSFHKTTLKPKFKTLTLDEVHLTLENRKKLNQFIEEFRYSSALKAYDLPVDNKLLFYGHTGCGKTATAHALGDALNKKVIVLNLGGFVSSRLGETAKNLSEVFRQVSIDRSILFIDEFDFLGKIRDYNSEDSGEMQRLVNTLIQQIDNLSDQSILICATNHLDIIDSALVRRFQVKLKYDLPSKEELDLYYSDLLSRYPNHVNKVHRKFNISYAEAKDWVHQEVKANIISYEKQKRYLVFSYHLFESDMFAIDIFKDKSSKNLTFVNGYTINDDNKAEDALPIAIPSPEHNLQGNIYDISGEELLAIDEYLKVKYKRVLTQTNSGDDVWIYISKY